MTSRRQLFEMPDLLFRQKISISKQKPLDLFDRAVFDVFISSNGAIPFVATSKENSSPMWQAVESRDPKQDEVIHQHPKTHKTGVRQHCQHTPQTQIIQQKTDLWYAGRCFVAFIGVEGCSDDCMPLFFVPEIRGENLQLSRFICSSHSMLEQSFSSAKAL